MRKLISELLKMPGKRIRRTVRQLVGNLPRTHIEIVSDYVFNEAIEGDYLEFGVFRGGSFISAYKVLEAARKFWASDEANRAVYSNKDRAAKSNVTKKNDIRYFAFDSFDGLPELKGVDKGATRFSGGRFDCSEPEFLSILKGQGVDLTKVTTVPGWYDKTLNNETKKKFNLKSAALVMVDCDLYESTRYVLDFITDLVVDGTVIVFDDWFCYKGHPEMGEQKATKEWLEKNPHIHLSEYHLSGASQKSFIVSILKNKGVKS